MKANKLLIAFVLVIAAAVYIRVAYFSSRQADTGSGTVHFSDRAYMISGSLDGYPDVALMLVFDTTPTPGLLTEMDAYSQRYAQKYRAWMSTVTIDSTTGRYMLGADFQNTPYNKAMVTELTDSLYSLSGQRLRSVILQ